MQINDDNDGLQWQYKKLRPKSCGRTKTLTIIPTQTPEHQTPEHLLCGAAHAT